MDFKWSRRKINLPTWEEIKEYLSELDGKAGTLTLDIFESGNVGPDTLQVRAESGNYLLTFGEETDDDYKVRFYWDPNLTNERLLILGEYWSERQLIKDFDLVVRIFKEFFETGNVSDDLLN